MKRSVIFFAFSAAPMKSPVLSTSPYSKSLKINLVGLRGRMEKEMRDSWNPSQYDKFKQERSLPFFDLLDLINPDVDMRIVDLGCGTGELTRVLHDRFKALTTIGIDNSNSMLEVAQAHTTAGISFENRSIEQFSSDKKFDLILANASLQWCQDHEMLFGKMSKMLSHRGQIAIQMPMNHDYATHTTASELAAEWRAQGLLKDHPRKSSLLSAEGYASLLFGLGFKKQSVAIHVYSHLLNDRESVIEWVRGTLLTYYKSQLSVKDFEKFLSEYQRRLFKVLPDTKPFFYPFKRILIWAGLDESSSAIGEINIRPTRSNKSF